MSRPLETDDRESFLGCFAPPRGYAFDSALGTTYTLNLAAMLLVPLAAAREGEDRVSASSDPLVLLEALRRASDRIAVFCEAGGMQVPPAARAGLLPFLEGRIVEAAPPSGAAFHPKLWVLRFTRRPGEGEDAQPVLLRLLVLTRNLTFDRSWDLLASLEGSPRPGAVKGYSRNAPLRDFLSSLPGMAVRPGTVTPSVAGLCASLADECRAVPEWSAPEPFEFRGFHASGIPGGRGALRSILDPAERRKYDRALVLSPFLTGDTVAALAKAARELSLVSRADALARLPDLRSLHGAVRAFAFADVEDIAPTAEDTEPNELGSPEGEGLVDLHAKLVVVEDGAEARWYLGSANATASGLGGRNTEFLVELGGRRRDVGVEAVLGDDPEDRYSLRRMLVPWDPERVPDPGDGTDEDAVFDRFCSALARMRLRGAVSEEEGGGFTLRYSLESGAEVPGLPGSFRIRPATLDDGCARDGSPLRDGTELRFEGLSRDALTILVGVRAAAGDRVREFLISVPVEGMPEDRIPRLLARMMADEETFLRFVRLLLGIGTGDGWGVDGAGPSADWRGGGFLRGEPALFETLLRAAALEPERLDELSRLIRDLDELGLETVPREFRILWDSISEAVGRKDAT